MESELIRWLRGNIRPSDSTLVGIGDDAAVLSGTAGRGIVVTTDMLMEGVDFEDVPANARRIGRKALAVNLSDLAAMAARPTAAFIALALPRQGGMRLAEELYAGMMPLAAEFGIAIAGGDTNSWDGPLVLSVTAIGEGSERGSLLRSGARPGDVILVTGEFGGSRLGRHFDFTPRVREAHWLHEQFQMHAAIDVSDGLSLDLARLAEESGCGAVIDLQRVPISPDAERWANLRQDGLSPLDHALSDGEDFELILATTSTEAARILATPPPGVPMTVIGHFIDNPGLWQTMPDGKLERLIPRGYEHVLT